MNSLCRRAGTIAVLAAIAVCVVYVGCGKKQSLEDADARIKALVEKGVPDSLLSEAKVFLFQANAAKASANTGVLRKTRDSLFIYLEQAEAWYEASMQQFKPQVDKLLAAVKERKAKLTGQQLMAADSMMAIIDSFVAQNWLLQAKEKLSLLDTMMIQLVKDEEMAAKFKKRLIGTWVGEQVPESSKYKAVDRRKYRFNSDGTLYVLESMKGQTEEFLKDDWLLESWGKWDVKGDTALLFIEKESCKRQTFWHKKEVKGRLQWVKEDKPTYDTTITDGSKDRFMTWEFMKQFLAKK